MKFIIGLPTCIAFMLCNTLCAQNTISGNIKDEKNKENLTGVSIYINDLKVATTSDSDGNYRISNLRTGTYLFEISFIGYKSVIKQISILKDTIINYRLSASVAELNEVVVTGVARATELRYSPIIVKTMDQNSLIQNSSNNLIDALKNVPGISQISTGVAISKPVIRGMGYNRVITLNNGIRQEGQQWGDEHGIEIDEYSVDRVEVVKGPGSLMYGSDGIAGVLNLLAPKAPAEGEIHTQLQSNFQSNNKLLGYSLSNAGSKYGLQWLGRFSYKLARNYKNAYDDFVYNSGFKEVDGSLFLGINKNWGHTNVTVSTYNNTLNLVEGERDSLGQFMFVNAKGDEVTAKKGDYEGVKIGFPHQEINHARVAVNNYFILSSGALSADVGFQNNKRKEFGDPTHPHDRALYFDLSTMNYTFKYNSKTIRGFESAVGVGGMYQMNKNRGMEFLVPNYSLFDVGVFLFTQKTIKNITIAGGFRVDQRHIDAMELLFDSLNNPVQTQDKNTLIKFNSFAKNYAGISGSIGFSYQISGAATLKLNISRGFRAPNIAELTSNGRHEGTFRYELGNTQLRSENSHQIDLAYFLNSEHLTFELSPFANFIGNYIYVEKLQGLNGGDSIPDLTSGAPAFQFTAANATLVGGELFIDLHPHPFDWLHLENSFSYVQASQKGQPDSSKYLPFIPAAKYRAVIKAELKKVQKKMSNTFVKFSFDYYFAQNKYYAVYGTESATPAYPLLGMGVGTNLDLFHKLNFLTLYFSIENMTDQAYQSHLSRLKYASINSATGRQGVYNMGRNIAVKLIVNI